MTLRDSDDDTTQPAIVTDELRAARRRTSSQSDLAELALEELRAMPGVLIPVHAELGAHGVLRHFGARFYEHGKRAVEVDLAKAKAEMAEEQNAKRMLESKLRSIGAAALKLRRGDISLDELVERVMGAQPS
ncbi:MAG: hypothetical protein AB7T06_39530 [Kofleriaceae bacterium]